MTVEYKRIESVTVYAARGISHGMGPDNVGPVVDAVLPALISALEDADVDFREPSIFWYVPLDDDGAGDDMEVWMSFAVGGEVREGAGWQVVELPAVARAATTRHIGAMSGIGAAWMGLLDAVRAAGEVVTAPTREVYLEAGEHVEWVTELQVPVG